MSFVRYFAYGSNMQTATLRGRRGIEFRSATPACADGWRLCLRKPSLLGGSVGIATIFPESGAHVWGVLYEIAESDLAHLDLTEGVALGHYERSELFVQSATSSQARARSAFAYTSAPPSVRPAPSSRYLALLLEGAREHGLPTEWIAMLERIEVQEENDDVKALRPLVDDLMRRRD